MKGQSGYVPEIKCFATHILNFNRIATVFTYKLLQIRKCRSIITFASLYLLLNIGSYKIKSDYFFITS